MRNHTHLGGIDGCAIASADPTAKETDFVQRSGRVDLSHSYLVDHCVLGEGAGTHELQHLLAPTGEPGVCGRHHVVPIDSPERRVDHM